MAQADEKKSQASPTKGKAGAGKKDGGKPSVAKASAHAAEPKAAPKGGAAVAAVHAGHHAPNRREYFVIFAVLFVLTILEVAVAQMPGIARVLVGSALVALALTKAACVGLFYMHLKHETRILKLTVAIPMATPMV